MENSRKQIAFDLDTKALQKYYPGESWNNAYEMIKNHMLNNGFKWLQGSVYVSEDLMEPDASSSRGQTKSFMRAKGYQQF